MNNEMIEVKKKGSTWGNWLWWKKTLTTILTIFLLFCGTYVVITISGMITRYSKVTASILTLQPKLDKEIAEQITDAIVENCIRKKLSPYLVVCLIFVESGYNQMATSNKNAIGLMQVHWDTWNDQEICKNIQVKEDLYQIEANIDCGTSILKKYIQEGGSVREGLNSYYGVESAKYHEKMASALYKVMF